jgi:hypothetical protein
MCSVNSAPTHFVSIRAIRLLLAIPEHEVSQQACRSKWQVGLDFSLAYRRADPNSSAAFSAPRLHLIRALEEVRREFLGPWRLDSPFCELTSCGESFDGRPEAWHYPVLAYAVQSAEP